MQGLDFSSDLISLRSPWTSQLSCLRPFYPSRLFVLWTYELFWRMESYYIITMDILWISLHPNKSPTDLSGPGYWHYCPDYVLPYILTACQSWPMTKPLHITMIMHEFLNELKTSVHWAYRCPSCGCDAIIKTMAGEVTSTGCMVRK